MIFFFSLLEICVLIWIVSFFGFIILERSVVSFLILNILFLLGVIFIFISKEYSEWFLIGVFMDFWFIFCGVVLEVFLLNILFVFLKN